MSESYTHRRRPSPRPAATTPTRRQQPTDLISMIEPCQVPFEAKSEGLPYDGLLYCGGAVPPEEIPEPFTAFKARLGFDGDKIDAESLAEAVDDIEDFAQKCSDGHLAASRKNTSAARRFAESQALQTRHAEFEKAAAQREQPHHVRPLFPRAPRLQP